MRDEGDAEAAVVAVDHSQAHPVQRHEPLRHDVTQDIPTGAEADRALDALGPDVFDGGCAVNVPLHQVTAQAGVQGDAALETDAVTPLECAEVRPGQRLGGKVHLEPRRVHGHGREAHAVGGHAVVHSQILAHPWGFECKPSARFVHLDGGDRAELLDDPGEHQRTGLPRKSQSCPISWTSRSSTRNAALGSVMPSSPKPLGASPPTILGATNALTRSTSPALSRQAFSRAPPSTRTSFTPRWARLSSTSFRSSSSADPGQ